MSCVSLDQYLLSEIAALAPALLAKKLEHCVGTLSGHNFIVRCHGKSTFDTLQRFQRALVHSVHKCLPAVVLVTIAYGTIDIEIPVYYVTEGWLPPVTSQKQVADVHRHFIQDHVPGCIALASGNLLFGNVAFHDRFPTLEIGQCVGKVHLGRSTFLPKVMQEHKALIDSEVLIDDKVASVRVNARLLFSKGHLMIASSVYA